MEKSSKTHLEIVNKPVTIKGWLGNYLQANSDETFFRNTNRLLWEHWMILPSANNYIIKSYRDGRNLGVDSNGLIHVRSTEENISEQWIIVEDPLLKDTYIFYSCYKNKVLQCNQELKGVTLFSNKQGWEQMVVQEVIPDTSYYKCQPRE